MKHMKKIHFSLFIIVICLIAGKNILAQSTTPFAGTWQLDKSKTKIQDLPRQLKDYKLIIAQSENQIGIKNLVDGQIEPQFENQGGTSRAPTSQESIWGDSRQTSSTGLTVKPRYGGSMALSRFFTPNTVTYNLDGKEVEIDIVQNEQVIGTAKTRAKPEKDGKSIKITTIRRMKTLKAAQTEMLIYVRERWDILDDGKSLRYVKTIDLPSATDEVTLYFSKDEKVQ